MTGDRASDEGRYRIDMVVHDGSRKLAVECDGNRYHGPEKMADDMNRQAILERLGWKFHRIRGTEFFRDPDAAMPRLFARLLDLDIQPSADDRADTAETYEEDLTQTIIRRAAEVRRSWDDPDADESPALLAFDNTQEKSVLTEEQDAADEFSVVTEPLEVARPPIPSPNSVTQSRQTVLTFTDLDDDEAMETASSNSDSGLVWLDQFDGENKGRIRGEKGEKKGEKKEKKGPPMNGTVICVTILSQRSCLRLRAVLLGPLLVAS